MVFQTEEVMLVVVLCMCTMEEQVRNQMIMNVNLLHNEYKFGKNIFQSSVTVW